MIDITFDEIGEHIEKGDLKEWLNELRILDAIKHLRTDEPKINADQHVQHVESVETMSCQECRRWIYDDRWGWFCPLKGQDECKYEPKTEPQTERSE